MGAWKARVGNRVGEGEKLIANGIGEPRNVSQHDLVETRPEGPVRVRDKTIGHQP